MSSVSKPQPPEGWHTPIFWFCGCRDRSERVTYADDYDALAAELAEAQKQCDDADFMDARIAELEAVLREVSRLRLATDEGTCARRFDKAWELACSALQRASKP